MARIKGLVLSVAGLAGCVMPTAAQQEAGQVASVAQGARMQLIACVEQVDARPDLRPIAWRLPNPATGEFTMTQMTDETVPTPAEAKLVSSWYDAATACGNGFLAVDFKPVIAERLQAVGALSRSPHMAGNCVRTALMPSATESFGTIRTRQPAARPSPRYCAPCRGSSPGQATSFHRHSRGSGGVGGSPKMAARC